MKKSELKAIIKEMMLTESVAAQKILNELSDTVWDSWVEILNDHDIDVHDDSVGTEIDMAFSKAYRDFENKLRTALGRLIK